NIAINDVRSEMMQEVQEKAHSKARDTLVDILYPPPPVIPNETEEETHKRTERYNRIKAKMYKLLDEGELDDREVELNIEKAKPAHIEIFSQTGMENIDLQLGELMAGIIPMRKDQKLKKMKVKEALSYMTEHEANRMVSKEKVNAEAKQRVENDGIIFIDELDKIAAKYDQQYGADVSRSGVQRDLLPIVEGSNVPTKYGIIDTSHILFIAAGAFNIAKPSDLIPELQGRFPIREELNSLSREDLKKILLYPKNSLTKQYTALFKSEGVALSFTEEAVDEIAGFASRANEKMEDIGARRLHTIMNALLDDYLFKMPDQRIKKVLINEQFVKEKLNRIIKDEDLSKYIL
ncbi:MAG: ATP-dependent protease ATPase subunit HslU, partial [Candidatus Cloacimonetes bacterium]|nr:ATP-dependent protease ATPase subunit HslU [Candidatus Cloacimonadota bacterium]